jgi:hypothetical protein
VDPPAHHTGDSQPTPYASGCVAREERSAGPSDGGSSTPKETEPAPMPGDDGVGFNDDECRPPVTPDQ